MKKNAAIALIVAVVLLAGALGLMATAGLNNKLTSGGCAVRIEVGEAYDNETVGAYIAGAGFNRPVVLEGTETAIEIETSAMSAEALEAAAQKLLSSVQADHAGASLSYAETFTAPEGVHAVRELGIALIAIAVAGYIYGALRFGWVKGLAPMLTALVCAVAAGSVCALLSSVLVAGNTLIGVTAGTACLSYVYAVIVCGKMKAEIGYSVGKGDMAVPVLVAVAAVLLTAFCGSVQIMACAVVGSVFAAVGMHCLAPIFWRACSK